MSINRVGHMVAPHDLPQKYHPAAALMEAVITAPYSRMLVTHGVQQHPGQQCTLVVLHMDLQISKDLVQLIRNVRPADVDEQAQGWQRNGLPPLYVFAGGSEMGANVAQFLAKDEAKALENFNLLRDYPVVGICVAPGGCVLSPLDLHRPAAAERERRAARRRRAGR